MEPYLRRGLTKGFLVGLLLIFSQPFLPLKGLLSELASFLVTVPLWIATFLISRTGTPLIEGTVILVYFMLVGALIGAAFERKALWGWLLVVALGIHHYVTYEQMGRQMGEIVQTVLNYFGK